jgi:hypothetical protein
LKKSHERLLLEYERRAAKTAPPIFDPFAPEPFEILTRSFTPPAAGGSQEPRSAIGPRLFASGAAPLYPLPESAIIGGGAWGGREADSTAVPGGVARRFDDDAAGASPGKRAGADAGGDDAQEGRAGVGAGAGGVVTATITHGWRLSYANSSSQFGNGDIRPVAGIYSALDGAGLAGVSLPLVDYSWRAPEAVPLRLHSVLSTPAFAPSAARAACANAGVEDLSASIAAVTRCVTGAQYARAHASTCALCGAPRCAALPPAAADAAPSPSQQPPAPTPAAVQVAPGDETENEGPANMGVRLVGGARASATAADYRAWALCSHCPKAVCAPCVFPTPSAAGVASAAARTTLLDAATALSISAGASSAEGAARGVSDVGGANWACPTCARGPARAGFDALPWCGGCCGALAAPPSWADTAADLAALQRARALAAPPNAWPPLLRCDGCAMRFHGACAWRARVAEVTLVGAVPRKAFLCAACLPGVGGVKVLAAAVGGGVAEGARFAPPIPLSIAESAVTREVVAVGRLA